MSATVAPLPKSAPRLFVDELLEESRSVLISGAPAHYLMNVMRVKAGAPIKLFDDRSGEYLAVVSGIGKRDLSLTVEHKLREREAAPDLWLCQALIKKDRLDWVAEKSCELGAARFMPVLTQRCVVDKVKDGRLRAQMIEAAEQCERTALPEIAPLTKISALLSDWPENRTLFFCDERGGDNFAQTIANHPGPAAILIGPEGGFTDEENAAVRAHPRAAAISLGPRILRADTAAAAAMAIWMSRAAASDWA